MSSAYWDPVIGPLSSARRVIAFDLPGHGLSPDTGERGRTRAMAGTVLAELDSRGLSAVHLAGHSMGGAVAFLMAMQAPERVLSLTLLAPGAFGYEIDARLLRRFASATGEAEIRPLLEQFYGWEGGVPEQSLSAIVADRRGGTARERYCRIAEAILDDNRQKVLPVARLAQLQIPVKVIWGTQDRITPTRQAHKLPGEVATHVFDGVGHSIVDEIPGKVVRLIEENLR